jgi:hypothetical protein
MGMRSGKQGGGRADASQREARERAAATQAQRRASEETTRRVFGDGSAELRQASVRVGQLSGQGYGSAWDTGNILAPVVGFKLRPDLTPGGPARVAAAPRPAGSPGIAPVSGARDYCLAGMQFRLRHPELLATLAHQESSYHSALDDAQALLARRRTPGPSATLGPLQLSGATIRSIERRFLAGPYPNDLKLLLLPKIRDDRDGTKRALDGHWSRTYAAAWVYMYEQQKAGTDPLKFIELWNGNPGGHSPLSWRVRRHYRQEWDTEAPLRMQYYRRLCDRLGTPSTQEDSRTTPARGRSVTRP